jgi:hypothetical protein
MKDQDERDEEREREERRREPPYEPNDSDVLLARRQTRSVSQMEENRT